MVLADLMAPLSLLNSFIAFRFPYLAGTISTKQISALLLAKGVLYVANVCGSVPALLTGESASHGADA
eukprot:1713891-Amphidinium_carterae.1